MSDRVFVRATGAAGGLPLVLLHGFGACHAVWSDIAETFAPTRPVLAYDLPGHAGSLGFAGGISAGAAARAILLDLTERGIDRAQVAGHSLGGAVATLMASIEPARVAALTLLAPGGFGERIDGAVLADYARAGTSAAVAACLARMCGPRAPAFPRVIEILVAMRRRRGQIDRLAEIADAISRDSRQGTFPDALLEGLAVEGMAAWGTADPVLPFAQSARLPSRFHLERVEGAGHMLIEETPDVVVRLIARAAP